MIAPPKLAPQDALLDRAIARLKESHFRVTAPRIALLSALHSASEPLTIDQLRSALDSDTCDLVTVYRCVERFEQLGLVRRSFRHNGTQMFETTLRGPLAYCVTDRATNRRVAISGTDLADEVRRAVVKIEDTLKAQGFRQIAAVVEFFADIPE